jgi:putative membrane protein
MRHAIVTMTTAGLALALAGCHNKTNNEVAAAAENSAGNVTDATANILSNTAADVRQAVTPTPTGQDFADKAAKSDAPAV